VSALLFQIVWLLVGVLALRESLAGMEKVSLASARNSYRVVFAFGILALATSATHSVRGRAFCFVGGVTGAVLGLYGLALILLGHEDVGGLKVALPFGAAAIALALWTLTRVRVRAREGQVRVA